MLGNKVAEFLKDLSKSILFYLIIVILFTQFITRPFRVEGISMMPNIKDSEVGFSNILSLKLKGIDRFDVVIVYVEETKKYLVKRVIGLPNETIRYEDDVLFINDEVVAEPFLNHAFMLLETDNGMFSFTHDLDPITLGEEEYFLLGDNRPHSTDSRNYGPFHKSQIKSKNGIIIYPFTRFKFLGA